MPSWNLHIHHAEDVLRAECGQRAIRDADAFLLGNTAPDIYVGWIVPDCTRKITYQETHFTYGQPFPIPRFWEFWERFGAPSADDNGRVSDVVLGAWAHLVADHVYNKDFSAFIEKHSIAPTNELRIRKQADYNLFGESLRISRIPRITPALLHQCETFPQYAIHEPDVRGAVRAITESVEHCPDGCIDSPDAYSLLTHDFLEASRARTCAIIERGLNDYIQHGANAIISMRG